MNGTAGKPIRLNRRAFSGALLALSGSLLLCTPFAVDPELAGGIQSAQAGWFQGCALLWAVCVLLSFLIGGTNLIGERNLIGRTKKRSFSAASPLPSAGKSESEPGFLPPAASNEGLLEGALESPLKAPFEGDLEGALEAPSQPPSIETESAAPGKALSFTWPDGWILAFGCLVFLTYRWELNPEPEKILFAAQVLALWFTWRYALGRYPELQPFFLVVFLCTGLLEAVRGMEQLHGWSPSNHSMFRLTGSFFNPGPYSGYLAMILPVCLGIILRSEKRKHTSEWPAYRGFYYFGWITLAAIVAILPAGMSRSAWAAALISCAGVYGFYRKGGTLFRWIRKNDPAAGRAARIGGIACLLILLMAGGTTAYRMKKDSAEGRFLMWKITARACMEQLGKGSGFGGVGLGRAGLGGTGLGGFPAAYASAQAAYFASGEASETEKRVAGAPEYAFNEYLQIGLEEGIAGGLIFLLWIGSCVRYGIRGKRYGVCGGIVALGIFAVSSYPLQLPPFWMALLLLGAYTPLTDPPKPKKSGDYRFRRPRVSIAGLSGRVGMTGIAGMAGIAGVVIGTIWMQKGYYACYKQWNKARSLYHAQAYTRAVEDYAALYEPLKHKPEFLFEGAQCLAKTGRPAEANRWLSRAVRLSADPMLYYVMARNEQALGKYEEAEKHLLYAADMLPERTYPYYLLVKLYAEPAFRRPEKMEAAARQVLEKKAKVESTAIREMREEVKKIRTKTDEQNGLNRKPVSSF